MNTIALDVHTEFSQVTMVSEETGEVFYETKVPTTAEDLARVVTGVPRPKRVIFEEGPLSGMISDALADIVDEIVSCDPTQNALIAHSDNSSDERDARRLARIFHAGAVRPVYVPPERFRTLRSLLAQDASMAAETGRLKNRTKGLCRRHVIKCRGERLYKRTGRDAVLDAAPSREVRWQLKSLFRRLDFVRMERVRSHRELKRLCRAMPVVERLRTIPGVGPITAPTVVAWIVDPTRFPTRGKLSCYAGLGIRQDVTAWKQTGRAHASRRGQRALKRVLFIAARAAIRGDNALARRYHARLESGWESRKAIRDIARTMLFIMDALWKKGGTYDDALVRAPEHS